MIRNATILFLLLVEIVFAQNSSAKILTLEEAVQTARIHQPQLLQAQANAEAAQARVNEAKAPLLPQVNGSADYSRSTANFANRPGSIPGRNPGGSSSFDTFNFFNFGVSANQLIYDFGQAGSRYRASKASAHSQMDIEKATMQQIILDVRTNYFQARAAKALVTIAQETLDNQNKHLEQIQGFVEVGTRPEIDLASAKTNVANAQVQLINAQNAYAVGKVQLNQSMGIEGPTDYDVEDESFAPVPGEDDSSGVLANEALGARPELAAMEEDLRAQELTIQSIRGEYYPSIDFNTDFTDAGQEVGNLAWNWSAALSLSIPVFQGGLTKARVVESQAQLKSLQAQATSLRQQILVELEQARLAVIAAKAAVDASAEAETSAREQLDLAEGRYQTGFGNIIELSDAQLAETNAAQQKVAADYRLSQARAGLLKALGRE